MIGSRMTTDAGRVRVCRHARNSPLLVAREGAVHKPDGASHNILLIKLRRFR